MADEKNPSRKTEGSDKPAPVAETTSGLLSGQAFLKTMNDALQQYAQSLKDAHAQGVKRSEELYQEYLKSQREQQTVSEETIKEDYRSYVSTMQQAWGQEQPQAKMEEATRAYVTATNDRQNELRRQLETLQQSYMDTVQKHVTQVQQNYMKLYQDYLRAFQQSWTKADVANLDANTLANAGRVLITASAFAGQTMQPN